MYFKNIQKMKYFLILVKVHKFKIMSEFKNIFCSECWKHVPFSKAGHKTNVWVLIEGFCVQKMILFQKKHAF